jgi:hypothetical protein
MSLLDRLLRRTPKPDAPPSPMRGFEASQTDEDRSAMRTSMEKGMVADQERRAEKNAREDRGQ